MIPKHILAEFEEYCKQNSISAKERGEKLKLLEKMIIKYKYEPGEAVGILAAQSISEPATQMSLDYKEKIIVKYKDIIKINEIGDFVDNILENIGSKKIEGWDTCDISEHDIYVPSFNKNEKIEWRHVTMVSRHPSPVSLVKISTNSGRSIVATDSHSFVIRKNNEVVPVEGKELKIGDRIPSIKFLPENCIQQLELNSILDVSETKFARKPLPDKMELDGLLGWIFGAYLAEGNCTKNYVSISNTNEEFLSKVREFSSIHEFTYNEYDNLRGFAKGHDIRINSTLFSRLLKKTCGTGAKSKKVPDFAYSASEKFVSGLLRGYFDGDGNISVERPAIRVSSSSEELINGIALLLTRFGIFANKLKGREFSLSIPHKYSKIFKCKIGLTIEKKRARLEKLCRLNPTKQDFTDMVSGFDNIFWDIAKRLRYPTRYVNNFTKRQKIGKGTIIKYINIFDNLATKKNIDISNELSTLKRMAYSDAVWDEIIDISKIKHTSPYVYDLSIDNTETFTTFDGIVTHNTMRSYTLASQSDRLSKVTQGLPRLIEIFDARKTFEKNTIIYLKPEYNSKEKAKEIANKIKSLKISDVIRRDSIDLVNMRLELELEKESDKGKIKDAVNKFLKGSEVSFKEKGVCIKPKKDDIKNLRKIKNKLLDLHIDGIKGIENVVVIREDNDWVIQTAGTNLKKILELKEVDISRIKTNDVHQVFSIMGIEAARNVILHEAKETLDEQGLEVDVRHLMLLADMMTFDGEIKAIGRYGVSGKKASVLARANFEETKKHIVNASFYGEVDKLEGIIENILIGQIAPVGTGMIELGIDMSKMKQKAVKEEKK